MVVGGCRALMSQARWESTLCHLLTNSGNRLFCLSCSSFSHEVKCLRWNEVGHLSLSATAGTARAGGVGGMLCRSDLAGGRL